MRLTESNKLSDDVYDGVWIARETMELVVDNSATVMTLSEIISASLTISADTVVNALTVVVVAKDDAEFEIVRGLSDEVAIVVLVGAPSRLDGCDMLGPLIDTRMLVVPL